MNSKWFTSLLRDGERIEVRGSITDDCLKIPTLTLPSPFQRDRQKIAPWLIVPNI
jgi:hypothetical protein